jgi:drug/metabolite transporter (DMT)-like permease
MAHQKKAYLALTVTSLVWGTTWVASKMGVSHMPAFELASADDSFFRSFRIF